MALPRRTNQPGADTPTADGTPAPDGAPAGGADWRAHYAIEDQDAVEAYLARHPTLPPILAEAPSRIAQAFGPDVTLAIELVHDPDDGSDFLYLLIRTMVDDAYERLEQLDDEWWLDAAGDAQAALEIAVRRG